MGICGWRGLGCATLWVVRHTHTLTHSLTHSPTHSLTHSLTTRSSPGLQIIAADWEDQTQENHDQVSIGSTTNNPFDFGVSQKTIVLPISTWKLTWTITRFSSRFFFGSPSRLRYSQQRESSRTFGRRLYRTGRSLFRKRTDRMPECLHGWDGIWVRRPPQKWDNMKPQERFCTLKQSF